MAVEGFGKFCGGIEGEFIGASFSSFNAADDVDMNARCLGELFLSEAFSFAVCFEVVHSVSPHRQKIKDILRHLQCRQVLGCRLFLR